jgi:hypothetical protein
MASGQLAGKNRGRSILDLLRRYGPLSFRGVKSMIEPPIKDRRLHDAIARVHRNGFVEKRLERVFRGAGVFYQITQDKKKQTDVASILECRPEDLRQPFFRNRELLHAESCAMWTHSLKSAFPEALIIRDFEFYGNPIAQQVLLTDRNNYELRPDMLMTFVSNSGASLTSVAFEIERSRKSERRLIAKLNKYASETLLDGVVYICDSKQTSEPVRRTYESRIMERSLRIRHYKEHFLLFQNEEKKVNAVGAQTFNALSKPVSLEKWIQKLRSTQFTARRDQSFTDSAISC